MKKLLMMSLSAVFLLAGCGSDEYADLRKMTVQDYLNNKEKMIKVLAKCSNHEIKDKEICETAKQASNNNHKAW